MVIIAHRQIENRLRKLGDEADAEHLQHFFKTGKGEYGEGDRFLGIRVPVLRKCIPEYRGVELGETVRLLRSRWHEARLLALLMLVDRYRRGSPADQREIYRAYMNNTAHINNWDLVDLSAQHVVGAHLFERSRKPLYRLARSRYLWERRISIVSTFHFIGRGEYFESIALAEVLVGDEHDLIHKAVGWVLREVGKRDLCVEEEFLRRHHRTMPRTMLRYAIERFPERKRQAYLKGRM